VLISVIIATYNDANAVAQAVRSVIDGPAFNPQRHEVIVVDDGSKDETQAVLAAFGDRITAITQQNAGPGVARNTGITAASGQSIAFLDSDDLYFPWTLEYFERAARQHPDAAIISGNAQNFVDPKELESVEPTSFSTTVYKDYLSAAPHILPSYTMVRADLLRRVGGFATRRANAEDVDLWLKLADAGSFVRIDGPTVGRRVSPTSLSYNPVTAYAGFSMLLDHERDGVYAGGAARRKERLHIILKYAGAVLLAVANGGHTTKALRLYARTAPLAARQGKWRYVFVSPIMLLVPPLRPLITRLAGARARRNATSRHK